MAFFYGINTDSSYLFSSLGTKNTNKTSSFDMTGLLTDYSSIKNGSYKKLLNAYYNQYGKQDTSGTTSIASDSNSKLANMKEAAGELRDTAYDLANSAKKSLFEKVETKDKDGNVTEDYDREKIYKTVKGFVDDYNSLMESTEKSDTVSVAVRMNRIIQVTQSNEDLLNEVGIKVNEDFTLEIDEEEFKKADMSTVKSMFTGNGSFAYQIAGKASLVENAVSMEAGKAATYTNAGKYSYNYSAGSIYNTWF